MEEMEYRKIIKSMLQMPGKFFKDLISWIAKGQEKTDICKS